MQYDIYKDRREAAHRLAAHLRHYKGVNGIVLAIPRGGIPIGYVLSRTLQLPLEPALSKKIGHPLHPEYAIGSVTLHGVMLNENAATVDSDYIQKEASQILSRLKNKLKDYTQDGTPASLKDKIVILTDDGIATGSTILAMNEAIRKEQPSRIVIAVPVAPRDTIAKLKLSADEVICPLIPSYFIGVGQFYLDFSEVSDEEVRQMLSDSRGKSEQTSHAA
ncbi:MAG: phosphoribosyltransferase family protein [Bacteroidota bacterium]